MSNQRFGRLAGEGHYLGGMFHSGQIFWLALKVFVDVAITLAIIFLFLRLVSFVFQPTACVLACLDRELEGCCWQSLSFISGSLAVLLGSFVGSYVATLMTNEKMFLRSTLLTGLVVVAFFLVALLRGLPIVPVLGIVILSVPIMFSGYRSGLRVRKKRRQRQKANT